MTAALEATDLRGLPSRATFLESARIVIARLIPSDAILRDSEGQLLASFDTELSVVGVLRGRASNKNYTGPKARANGHLLELRIDAPSKSVGFPKASYQHFITIPLDGSQLFSCNELISAHGPRIVFAKSWTLLRHSTEYRDTDYDAARKLQPLLSAVESAYPPVIGGSSGEPTLTARELEVLEFMAQALSAKDIARLLRISPATVRKHQQNLYLKLGCSDRLSAIIKAHQLGLLHTPRNSPTSVLSQASRTCVH